MSLAAAGEVTPPLARRLVLNRNHPIPYTSGMSTLSTLVTWVCAAVVSLPLAPCAFITEKCCPDEVPTQAAAPQPAGSCCADHAKPVDLPSGDHEPDPCSGRCCQLSPYVQLEKQIVDLAPLGQPALISTVDEAPLGQPVAVAVSLGEPISLQVLHCRWRC